MLSADNSLLTEQREGTDVVHFAECGDDGTSGVYDFTHFRKNKGDDEPTMGDRRRPKP